MSLYQKLTDLNNSDVYPFHMPGHKRNMVGYNPRQLYDIDITEIDGFDNLHHARGILKEIQDKANKLYDADKTWISINGSTAGILSAISAVCNDGETIIMDRRSHKSAYNACALKNLNIKFIYPSLEQYEGILAGRIDIEEVEEALKESPEAKAVFITSPSYDGIISDVKSIGELCHDKYIPLIVDAAHGAHFILDKRFGCQALTLGADIVIHSIHKTLPAPTQTALLSVKSQLVDTKRLERYMAIYQTSSPSYVLMAGVENCLDIVANQASELTGRYFEILDSFVENTKSLKNIRVLSFDKYKDPSKLIVYPVKNCKKISGAWIGAMLRHQFKLEPEMITPSYVCCLTSIMDTKEGFDRLAEALLKMDGIIDTMPSQDVSADADMAIEAAIDIMSDEKSGSLELQKDYSLRAALEKETRWIELKLARGHQSAGFVQLYPPGIPILIPGQEIRDKHIDVIYRYIECNLDVEGMHDKGLWILK